MRKIILDKADPLGGEEVKSIIIEISNELQQRNFKSNIEKHYSDQATLLVDALINSLPRGTIDRILVKLMQKNLSSYRGLLESDR